MSFQSLIAHNGVNHQKSSSGEKSKESPNKVQHDNIKHNSNDSQTVTPKLNSASEKQVLEIPETKLDTERETESLTTTETTNSDTATLVPGFGESIFALLIASPFLLLGLKKWIHK